MPMKPAFIAALTAIIAALSFSEAGALEITVDTVWSGVAVVTEDTRVAAGATLTIEPGTRVLFEPSDSTKTDPQFWNPDTELAVEGRLVAGGSDGGRVMFAPRGGSFGGIIIAEGGKAEISGAAIEGADQAILVKGGEALLTDLLITGSDYAIVAGPGAKTVFSSVKIKNCKVGVADLTGGALVLDGLTIEKSADADVLRQNWPPPGKPEVPPGDTGDGGREFVGEYTVDGTETWRGRIMINDRVTVPPGSTLKIEPGTKILFRKKDTNGDGLGEAELLVLGSIRCNGTEKNPIIFDSAEEAPKPGDWDKVSIISSEDPDNSFSHTVFRHGVQALHAHFSSFGVTDSLFEGNLRALQFQESEKAAVKETIFRNNKQALRFRDSKVTVVNCLLDGNDYAVHAFRCELKLTGNKVKNTVFGGVLAKETKLSLKDNDFERNFGSLRQRGEGSTLRMEENRLVDSVETAMSLSGVEAEIRKNHFSGAGLDLTGFEGGQVVLRENRFGVSNRSAVHLNSPTDVDAGCNDWSGNDPASRIHDKNDDPTLGRVLLDTPCKR